MSYIETHSVSRRSFIKGLGIGAGTALAVATIGCEKNSANPEAEALRKQLSAKYNVFLTTAWEMAHNMGIPYSAENVYNPNTDKWTVQKLEIMDKTLAALPPKFYQPDQSGRQKGEQLAIAITPAKASTYAPDKYYAGEYSVPGYFSQILLNADSINPRDRRYVASVITHELIHRITPELAYLKEAGNPNAPEPAGMPTPWFDAINTILGAKYSEVAQKYHDQVSSMYDDAKVGDNTPDERTIQDRAQVYGELMYGFSRTDRPIEFLAVMGPHYLSGRDFFITRYTEVFGAQKAEAFYDFVKTQIFEGREYKEFPVS